MKIISTFLLVFAFNLGLFAAGGVVVLEGKYQSKNLYVQNGFAASGVGFCAYEVWVNGQLTTDEVNSSAFEVDLATMNLKPGSDVVVQIKYKEGCSPQILNPEALKPKATFETVSIVVEKNGVLKWTTKKESGPLTFIVEQFRWNKWVPVGEVQGIGTPDLNEYTFKTTTHSGENRFRVKQKGSDLIPKISPVATYQSTDDKVTYAFSKNEKEVFFSTETMYEVYDMWGKIVKRGFGKAFSAGNLSKGMYYLCFDNTSTEFKKK